MCSLLHRSFTEYDIYVLTSNNNGIDLQQKSERTNWTENTEKKNITYILPVIFRFDVLRWYGNIKCPDPTYLMAYKSIKTLWMSYQIALYMYVTLSVSLPIIIFCDRYCWIVTVKYIKYQARMSDYTLRKNAVWQQKCAPI